MASTRRRPRSRASITPAPRPAPLKGIRAPDRGVSTTPTPAEALTLYTHSDHPDLWIGSDRLGRLYQWPRSGRWDDRASYAGAVAELTVADPATARGTGWPGAGAGRPRLAGAETGRRLTVTIPAVAHVAAGAVARGRGVPLSTVVREAIDLAIAKPRRRMEVTEGAETSLSLRIPESQHAALTEAARRRKQTLGAFLGEAIRLAVTGS